MIKVVSFDIGGTIIKGNDDIQYSMDSLSHLTNKPRDEVKMAYRDIFQKRKGSFNDLVDLFCQRLNISVTNEIIEFFHGNFNQDSYLDKGIIDIVIKLKKRGYKVILFSNTSNLYIDKLGIDLKNLVDDIFYSYDIGYTKDEEESYKYIERKLGVFPSEILHIGDSLNNDYLYPVKNGWNALFYGYHDGVKCISKMEDIFNYLDEI